MLACIPMLKIGSNFMLDILILCPPCTSMVLQYHTKVRYHTKYIALMCVFIFGAELLMIYSLVICKLPWMNEFRLRNNIF